jgi:hypothetical protein
MFMEYVALKPKLSKTEKLDATTDAAYEIIDKQILDRERKTALLKELRLARDCAASNRSLPRGCKQPG